MKKIILTIAVGLFGMSSYAQSYNEGDKLLNIGVGLGSTFTTGKSTLPPMSVSFEHGFTDKISAGGLLGYVGSKEEYALLGTTSTSKYTYITIAARGSYHFYTTDNIDVYGGALLGYNIGKSKVESLGTGGIYGGSPGVAAATTNVGGAAWGVYAGARYYFSDQFGAYAELGYGLSILNIGATIKF